MSELRRILVATDGTVESLAAVEAATSVACHALAEVRFLQVAGLDLRHRHGRWDSDMRDQALRSQAEALARLRRSGVAADSEIIHADPPHVGAAICEVARHYHADLLALGARGLDDWRILARQEPSGPVNTSIECPVLLVRARPVPTNAEPFRILLALAKGDDLERTVMPASVAASGQVSRVLVVQVESESRASAMVDTALKVLHEARVDADGWLLHPGPDAAIVAGVAARWQPDMIVLGSPSTSDLGRSLPVSVIQSLLRQPLAPVLAA